VTWSIVVRDKRSGAFAVAVSTCAFAVGARVPHADGGVGALATQAMTNPTYGPRGMALLRAGAPAQAVVDILTAGDEGRDYRQLHVQDAKGGIATHTGVSCVPWCGHILGDGFSIAGNMLAGPEVIAATAKALEALADVPLPERLIRALKAGEAAGGDKRGKQSAALRIHTTEDYPFLDLRVDDHADPLAELARLEEVSRKRFVHVAHFLAKRHDPSGTWRPEEMDAILARVKPGQAGL
jgi:uncharacterized Ntn-hydrolase superfamily protein